jgi:hypothetical protein
LKTGSWGSLSEWRVYLANPRARAGLTSLECGTLLSSLPAA